MSLLSNLLIKLRQPVLTVRDEVEDCRRGRFCLAEVHAERSENCTEYCQTECRPYRQRVETRAHRLHTSRTEQHVVWMPQDVACQPRR